MAARAQDVTTGDRRYPARTSAAITSLNNLAFSSQVNFPNIERVYAVLNPKAFIISVFVIQQFLANLAYLLVCQFCVWLVFSLRVTNQPNAKRMGRVLRPSNIFQIAIVIIRLLAVLVINAHVFRTWAKECF